MGAGPTMIPTILAVHFYLWMYYVARNLFGGLRNQRFYGLALRQ